jgi:hypothetical protein
MSVVGYVYVLKNEHIKPVKIGYTDRTPQERAEELSNFTGVPGKWKVCKSWKLTDAYDWEQRIFRELEKYRADGEFFLLTPDKAIELITLYLINLNAINSDGLSQEEIKEIRVRNAEVDLRTKRAGAEQKWKTLEAEFSNKAQEEAEKIYGKTIAQLYRDEENSRTSLDTAKDFIGVVTIPVWVPLTLAYKALFTDGKADYKETNPYVAMRNKIEMKQRELFEEYKKKFMREHGVNE